jgi:hypothetical protein
MRSPRSVSMVDSNDSRAWLVRVATADARWSGAAVARLLNPLRTRPARLLRSTQTWAAVVGSRSNGIPRSTAVDRASASAATPCALADHCVRCRLRANRKYSPAIRARPTTTMITITAILVPETLLLDVLVVVVDDEVVVVTAVVVVVAAGAVVAGAVVAGVVGGAVVAGAVVTGAVVAGVVGAAVVAALVGDPVVAVCAVAGRAETATITRAAAKAEADLFMLG